MKAYYGTKRIEAAPAPHLKSNPKLEANQHDVRAGVELLDGYKVRYLDGYESWSPRDVFNAAYLPETSMDFSGALQALRDGYQVCRLGWSEGLFRMEGGKILIYRNMREPMEVLAVDSSDVLAFDWAVIGRPNEPPTEAFQRACREYWSRLQMERTDAA